MRVSAQYVRVSAQYVRLSAQYAWVGVATLRQHGDQVGQLARTLGWEDPVIPQSMYIFKQPRIGGEITSHQVLYQSNSEITAC